MSDIKLIEKYIPEELVNIAKEFEISEESLYDMSDIVIMILKSKSIDTKEEKQNWLNLLPLMNSAQLDKLKDILNREKEKLEEIEKKYEKKKVDIKRKYLLKWQQLWYIKKVSEIKEKEEALKSEEDKEAEDLLDMI